MSEGAHGPLQRDREVLFGTPVYARQWPECDALNDGLARFIETEVSLGQKRRNSNSGGWQSPADLFARKNENLRRLKSMVDALLLDAVSDSGLHSAGGLDVGFRIDAWANVTKPSGYNIVHAHPNALWSGVYYVKSGGEIDQDTLSGKIEFIDPRAGADQIQLAGGTGSRRHVFANRPGLMLLFPGWLKHMVHPHQGDGSRISIAFNAVPVASGNTEDAG